MGLAEQLQDDMKAAMRAKDTVRLDTVRMLRATLQSEAGKKYQRALDALIQARGVPLEDIPSADLPTQEPLGEDEIVQIIGREVKKRQDSVEAYQKGGRAEMAASEQAEIAILQSYLPAQLSADELRPLVQAIITEVGATSKADLKKVMPLVMGRLRNKADGRTLNQVVGELLS